jgi:hypothetical protein
MILTTWTKLEVTLLSLNEFESIAHLQTLNFKLKKGTPQYKLPKTLKIVQI